MDDMNNLITRCTACTLQCPDKPELSDTYYLNGAVPETFAPDNTQTQSSSVSGDGVFAVFSGINASKRSVVRAVDDFTTSIVNCGKVAVDACIGQLTDDIGGSFSFAMVRLKGQIGQIFYSGSSKVYIYRGGKVIMLTTAVTENPEDLSNNDSILFTPEFKLLENDALLLCTDGSNEVLDADAYKKIFDNTTTSKAAACSVALSSAENNCTLDATAIVLRVKKETEKAEKIPDREPEHEVYDEPQSDTISENIIEDTPVVEDLRQSAISEFDELADGDDMIDSAKKEYLGMSLSSWIIIGTLTAALGVITGMIILMFT